MQGGRGSEGKLDGGGVIFKSQEVPNEQLTENKRIFHAELQHDLSGLKSLYWLTEEA